MSNKTKRSRICKSRQIGIGVSGRPRLLPEQFFCGFCLRTIPVHAGAPVEQYTLQFQAWNSVNLLNRRND